MKLSKEVKSIFVSFKINKTYHYLQHFLVFEIFMVSNLFQKLYLHENLKVVKKIYSMKNFDFWKKNKWTKFSKRRKITACWKSTTWRKVGKTMKVDKLMKSSGSDESRQPDEKFGKWWKSTTWWKVWKVMKVDNLMKSLESDETRQPDEKLGKWWNLGKRWKKCNLLHGLSFRHFFVQANFAQKLFFDFKVTYFDKQKQQKNCLEKREWNWFEEATRLRGNFEPNNCTRLPISTAILHSTILLFTFEFFWVDHKSE